MADYLSGGITFQGLGSGTDFTSMITELKKIESIPKNRYEAWRADWQERYDAFDELLTSCTDLMKKFEGYNTMNKMLSKKVTSSTNGVASATASAGASEGTYGIDVKQLATNSVLTLTPKVFSGKDEVVIGSGGPATSTLDYNYKGKDVSIKVYKGMSIQGLVEQINKDPNNPGVKASLVKSGSGYVFQLQGKDTGSDANISIKNTTTLPGFGMQSMARSQNEFNLGSPPNDNTILFGTTPESFVYTTTDSSGVVTEHKYPPAGSTGSGPAGQYTVGDVVRSIQADPNSGLTAAWKKTGTDSTGTWYALDLRPKDQGSTVNVTSSGVIGSFYNTPANWNSRTAQDAKFTLNGLDDIEYTSASNELKEVFDGLNINLTDEGKTTLTVNTDTSKVKDNVVAFVDGFNELLSKFQELTKVNSTDTSISTGQTQKDKNGQPIYDSPKGSILTGNYGVQLLSSQIKNIASGTGLGFLRPDGKGGGDIFSSLASIGIVMDSEEGSPTFGQLKILERDKMEPDSPYMSLDEALEKDASAVADLLAGTGGVSDTPQFTFDNVLTGVTKAGVYDVNYSVTGGVMSDVFIGGIKAHNAGNGIYTLMDGPGRGMTISILDASEGNHSGTVRVKQGKVSELHDLLAYQLKNESMDGIKKDPNAPAPQRGALQVLKDNYADIMKSIDKKIADEEARLVRWERTQKQQFSRLDTLLGGYDKQMQANASALGGLVPFGS